MELIYNFSDYDDKDFVYKTNLKEYINSLNKIKLLDIASKLYKNLDSDFISDLKKDYGINSVLDFKVNLNQDNVIDAARYIIEETDSDVLYEFLENDIKDFYENKAKEVYNQYLEDEELAKDPYKGSGLKQSDFI